MTTIRCLATRRLVGGQPNRLLDPFQQPPQTILARRIGRQVSAHRECFSAQHRSIEFLPNLVLAAVMQLALASSRQTSLALPASQALQPSHQYQDDDDHPAQNATGSVAPKLLPRACGFTLQHRAVLPRF